jgi:hypothetical protein
MQSLYKSPGAYVLGNYPQGVTFDCVLVAPSEIEEYLIQGWAMTPDDALNMIGNEPQPPEQKRRGRPPKAKE